MGGQVVLNGRAEGLQPGLSGCERHAPSWDMAGWDLADDPYAAASGTDPTLLETALAPNNWLKQALNLDGGSSTTLVVAGRTVMNGRGFPPAFTTD